MKSQRKVEEKHIFLDGMDIYYRQIGDQGMPIILLHGWGVSSGKYSVTAEFLSQAIKKETQIYIPDMPGFGKSDDPQSVWSVIDYAEFAKKFADHFSLKTCILIGHSFGGRVAIKLATMNPERIRVLILTGAAGIKKPLTIKQKIFFILAKKGKALFSLPLLKNMEKQAQKYLYLAAREKDYYEANSIMKEVFKKVVDEDLTPYLSQIKIPTLLIWGNNDRSTPMKDGKEMNKRIKNSHLEIIKEANHSLPYQYPEKFAKIIKEFIG